MQTIIHTGMYGNKAFLLAKALYTNFNMGRPDPNSKYTWSRIHDTNELSVARISYPDVAPTGEVVIQVDTTRTWSGERYLADSRLGNPQAFKAWLAEKIVPALAKAKAIGGPVKIRAVTTFPAYTEHELGLAHGIISGADVSAFPKNLREKWMAGDCDPVKYELNVAKGEQIAVINEEFKLKHQNLVREFRVKRSEALAALRKELRQAIAALGKEHRAAVRGCRNSFNPALSV